MTIWPQHLWQSYQQINYHKFILRTFWNVDKNSCTIFSFSGGTRKKMQHNTVHASRITEKKILTADYINEQHTSNFT